jgi:hypothetical protein
MCSCVCRKFAGNRLLAKSVLMYRYDQWNTVEYPVTINTVLSLVYNPKILASNLNHG